MFVMLQSLVIVKILGTINNIDIDVNNSVNIMYIYTYTCFMVVCLLAR